MLLLQYENEGDLVDSVILQHVFISGLNDFFSLVDADNFERVVQVCDRDLLDLKNIIAVEDGFKVLCCEELSLELIEAVVMGICLAKLFALDRLEHFKDGSLRVLRLVIQDVGHQFLKL